MNDPAVSKYAGRFGFAPAPAACAGCPAAAYWAQDSWVIPANTTVDRDLLFRVVMEGTNARAQAAVTPFALGTRTALSAASGSPYWKSGIDTIQQGASALPRLPFAYLASNAIERYGIQALLLKTSPKKALDDAAHEFSTNLASSGFFKRPPMKGVE